jgi:hypothetical protein
MLQQRATTAVGAEPSTQRRRIEAVEREVSSSVSLDDIEAQVISHQNFSVLVQVLIYGYPRGKVMHHGYKGLCNGGTLEELKEKIYEVCSEHIEGTAMKFSDGRTEVEVKKPEDGYKEFHTFIKLRRRQTINLNQYSEGEANNDRIKKETIDVCVYKYGWHCDSDLFGKVSASSRSSGSVNRTTSSDEFEEAIKLLKDTQSSNWSAPVSGNWGVWATHLLRVTRRNPERMIEEAKKDPPYRLQHLFFRPNTRADQVLREMRTGSSTFLDMLTALIEQENNHHREILSLLEHNRTFFTSLREHMVTEENDVSLDCMDEMINQDDIDHI